MAACSATTKAYWTQWDSLEVVDGILYRRWEDAEGYKAKNLLLAPKSIWNEILQHLHNSSTAGHLGIKKTVARVRERFYWLNSRKFVANYCKRCDEYSSHKGPQKKWKAPLKLYQVGSPMERVAVDVLGPLPKTNDGNQYIVIAQDYFTKWPEAFPVPDQKATTVADVLVNQFFTRFGIPQELHSDQGRNFESEVFQDVCKLLGIHKTRTTPYHPQSDGMVERFNRTLGNGLSMFVNQNHTDWDKHVPFLLMAYRSATHETTKVTPGQMMFGRELKLPVDLWQERTSSGEQTMDGNEHAEMLQNRLGEVHNFARENIDLNVRGMKQRYDLKSAQKRYPSGSGVWLHTVQQKKGRSPKLSMRWEGPYVVVKHLNDVVVRIKKGPRAKAKVVHVNNIKKYNGDLRFDWFTSLRSEDNEGPTDDLNTTSGNERHQQRSASDQVEETAPRRSKRTRNKPKRLIEEMWIRYLSGTDKLGRGGGCNEVHVIICVCKCV